MNYLLRARINFLISCYYNYSLGFTDMILASRRQGSTAVLAGHTRSYYIDTTVLLENTPFVNSYETTPETRVAYSPYP